MYLPPETSDPVATARALPSDLWRRLGRVDEAFQLELFRTANERLRGEPEQWAVTVRHRESGAELLTVLSDTIPFALAMVVIEAEKRGLTNP